MENKKELNVRLVELFMAKAGRGNKGFDRCFYGTIKREHDSEGNPVVRGKIKVNDGYIIAMATNQLELGDMLDQIVILILEYGLHSDSGKTKEIWGIEFYMN